MYASQIKLNGRVSKARNVMSLKKSNYSVLLFLYLLALKLAYEKEILRTTTSKKLPTSIIRIEIKGRKMKKIFSPSSLIWQRTFRKEKGRNRAKP